MDFDGSSQDPGSTKLILSSLLLLLQLYTYRISNIYNLSVWNLAVMVTEITGDRGYDAIKKYIWFLLEDTDESSEINWSKHCETNMLNCGLLPDELRAIWC